MVGRISPKLTSGLSGTAIKVLLGLIYHADDQGRVQRTLRELASDIDSGESVARRGVYELIQAQLVDTADRTREGNVYFIKPRVWGGVQVNARALVQAEGQPVQPLRLAQETSPAGVGGDDSPAFQSSPIICVPPPSMGDISRDSRGFFISPNERAGAPITERHGAPARATANSVPPPYTPLAGRSVTPKQQRNLDADAARSGDKPAARENTWLGSLPSEVRAQWDQLSFDQKKLIRQLRDRAEFAGVRGVHPAEAHWAAALEHVRQELLISEDVATLIVYLAPMMHIDAATVHVRDTKAAKYPGGIPGSAYIGAICQDWAFTLGALGREAQARRAQEARAQAQREQAAAAEAQAARAAAQARLELEALQPLGVKAVWYLIDRAIRRADHKQRGYLFALRQHAIKFRRDPWNSAGLRELAYRELTEFGPVETTAAGAVSAAEQFVTA